MKSSNEKKSETARLARLDHAHIWHPFTPMKQWREAAPVVIDRAKGDFLIDLEGREYLDGVSSLWCNVHGHCVPEIDQAVRDQLDKVAHTTLLGLASPPSIELAAKLAERCAMGANPQDTDVHAGLHGLPLNKVFYSDAGATALEVAFKMAVGYWFHNGPPGKRKFIGLREAYHGDTTGSMSVGYSDLFHKPFLSMVFDVHSFANPDAPRMIEHWRDHDPEALRDVDLDAHPLPSMNEPLTKAIKQYCLRDLERLLEAHADETAAIVIEPVMQGAAGMVCQPEGFVRGVAELARKHNVLLIADEVAVGFGRTGKMFACEHDAIVPDIMCLAKGITGGYLPLAATLVTDAIDEAFCGELSEKKTLYHGHTYTGNPLACAAALASLDLFDSNQLLEKINRSSQLMSDRLRPLHDCEHVRDIRKRGMMVGIELCKHRGRAEPFDFSKRTGAQLCAAMRDKGVILRPLGDVIIMMPISAMAEAHLTHLVDTCVDTILNWKWD